MNRPAQIIDLSTRLPEDCELTLDLVARHARTAFNQARRQQRDTISPEVSDALDEAVIRIEALIQNLDEEATPGEEPDPFFNLPDGFGHL